MLPESLEPPVRAALEEARRRAQDALARPDAKAEVKAEAVGELGRMLHAFRLLDPAESCYRMAEDLAPQDPRWPYYRALVALRRERLEEAREHLRRTLERDPDLVPAWIRLGEIALQFGDLDAAEGAFQRARAREPDNAAALYGLGRVRQARGEAAGAVELLERALEIQPEADRIHYLLAQAYARLGREDEAERHRRLRGTRDVAVGDRWLADLAVIQRQVLGASIGDAAPAGGGKSTSEAEARRAVEASPRDPEAWIRLGQALVEQGRLEESKDAYGKAAVLDPSSGRPHFLLAQVLLRQGERNGAEAALARGLSLDPDNAGAHLQLGALKESSGALDEALDHYRRAMEADPDRLPAYRRAGLLLARMGRWEEAVGPLSTVARAEPEDIEVRLALAWARVRTGDPEAAREHADAAAARLPEGSAAVPALLSLAELELALGRYRNARRHLEAALSREPGQPHALSRLARVLAAAPDDDVRDAPRAVELAQQAFGKTHRPEDAETLALALAGAGRVPEALAIQQRLVDEARRRGESAMAARFQQTLDRLRAASPSEGPPQRN